MEKKKSLFGILAVIFAVSIVTSCGKETDKIQLQLSLQQGESYNLKVTSDQKISQTIQGRQQDTNQTTSIGQIFNVKEVDTKGNALVTVTYHSVVFKQDGPMGKIEYDSSHPPASIPLIAKGFSTLVGQSFSIVLSPDGHIIDVQGVDVMLTQMMKRLDMPEGPMKNAIEKNLRDHFGDQAIKEMMEKMMAIYPDEPVGIGDSWTKKIVASKVLPMTLDNTWTLKGLKDGIAVIGVHSVIKSNPSSLIQMGNVELSYDISGRQEGTLELEQAKGWTTRAHLTQNLSGQVRMESSPQVPQGMSWPISIDSTISLEPFET